MEFCGDIDCVGLMNHSLLVSEWTWWIGVDENESGLKDDECMGSGRIIILI